VPDAIEFVDLFHGRTPVRLDLASHDFQDTEGTSPQALTAMGHCGILKTLGRQQP